MIKLDIEYYNDFNDNLEKNVHTEHCCIVHGCKYGQDDCPVWLGYQRQSYICEMCYDDHNNEYWQGPKYNNVNELVVTVDDIKQRRVEFEEMLNWRYNEN